MTDNKKSNEPCKHIILEVISFHSKNFCISAECTICHAEFNEKNLDYSLLDGKFGVLVQDDRKRERLTLK